MCRVLGVAGCDFLRVALLWCGVCVRARAFAVWNAVVVVVVVNQVRVCAGMTVTLICSPPTSIPESMMRKARL